MPTPTPSSEPRPASSGGWLVSPAFDLAFLANWGWLLAFLPFYVGSTGTVHLEFWQVYFLTAPHRWLTLLLVASDPERREGRGGLFAAIALAAALVVGAVWIVTGGLACLAIVDFLWNAWHFGAQHAGVLRMYSRRAGGGRPRWETWSVRLLVVYVSLRLAGWTTGWVEEVPAARPVLDGFDLAAITPAALLWIWDAVRVSGDRLAKFSYLSSVCGLYLALLAAVRLGWPALVLGLATAGALFHAVEYLAVVSLYASRRRAGGPALFRWFALHWWNWLAAYVVLLGLVGFVADRTWAEPWLALNLWAAGLHYAYDGMIWKLRRPATAAALGVADRSASAGAPAAANAGVGDAENRNPSLAHSASSRP